MSSASAFATQRARESSVSGTLTLPGRARAAERPPQPARRRALRYHLHLAQRADRSPVQAVRFDDPAVFDAWSRLLVQCAVIGKVDGSADPAAAVRLSFRSELPLRRVFERLEPTVQACNRSLRDTPWQFLLQAGDS